MDVILDTNIFFDHFYLDNMSFKSLFAYLGNTKSNLLIPEIIRDEIFSKYEKRLCEYRDNITRNNITSNVLFRPMKNGPKITEEPVQDYKKKFEQMLKQYPIKIISYKNINLSEIVSRCVNGIHPFKQSANNSEIGFKDTVIWLFLLDLLGERNEICFITDDANAFGKDVLLPQLQDEANNRKLKKVNYYNSLEKFLSTCNFDLKNKINKQWLSKYSKKRLVIEMVAEGLKTDIENQRGLSKYVGDEKVIREIRTSGTKFHDFDIINYEDGKAYLRLSLETLVDVNYIDKIPKEGVLGYRTIFKVHNSIDITYAVSSFIINIIDESYIFKEARNCMSEASTRRKTQAWYQWQIREIE